MAYEISNSDRLNDQQQKEIIDLCNQAYDRGSADCLKILISTIKEMKVKSFEYPELMDITYTYEAALDGFLAIIEAVRQEFYNVVIKEVSDCEKTNIVTV